jgi:hypothetical protein
MKFPNDNMLEKCSDDVHSIDAFELVSIIIFIADTTRKTVY